MDLAARLESLCKQYGVDAIVSGAAVEEAQGQFLFRLLDRALLQRCRSLVARPPPPQWDGVHVAATK